ncbi:Protein of unknown function [Propionibacterium freudenreichii]|nr:Protein of unknown function [Propionibacterium freudenreichii]CEI28693.1 Protein of unknown function [Propionibacterium freudenreichii]
MVTSPSLIFRNDEPQ